MPLILPFPSITDFWNTNTVLWTVAVLVAIWGAWKAFYRLFLMSYLSPLRVLPRPKSRSFLWGNLREAFDGNSSEKLTEWAEEHGPTFSFKSILNKDGLVTMDTKAMSYILNHSYEWQRPPQSRKALVELLGEGVLVAEGDAHKRQRRVMNPSFARPYIRELTGIFHDTSQQLRDILLTKTAEAEGPYKTDIMTWLSKATLDIIGLAGFDYQFKALDPSGKDNELNTAFMRVMQQSRSIGVWEFLQALFPLLDRVPTAQDRSISQSKRIMDNIGLQLVADKKKSILESTRANDSGEPQIEKGNFTRRDLLTRLMAANMATDLPENQRLSDLDVLAQIPTFLLAGHETTAASTSWCLYALSRHPEIQQKLREELLSVTSDSPSMDELNILPYLDGVVRETLRLYAPVELTARCATKDDIVPLATPFKDRNGVIRNEFMVKKGQTIILNIHGANTYKGYWGEDAMEFRPERWQENPYQDVPGVFGGILTFLGGPRLYYHFRL
ncbi:cytochrome P450 [Hysterangium stoloniferum]|nr:cytochrome P450 [Hysterangium stoloniferum]